MKKNLKKVKKYFNAYWKRSILIVIALLIIFLVIRAVTAQPAGITSTQVGRGTLIAGFSANGKIKAQRLVDLKFNAPGKVAWISVKEGDQVGAWRGLAGLDAIPLDAAYQNAQSAYRNTQANTQMVLDSVKDHSSDESFTQKATRTAAESANDIAFNNTRATLDALQNSMLVTPFAGTVVDTNGIVGGMTLSGVDLESKFIRVVDLTSFYFAANVDEIDFSKVKSGQEVEVSVDAFPGQSCVGKVTKVGKSGEETTGGVVTIPVEVSLSGCTLGLAVNLNGEGTFAMNKVENALIVPKKYLVTKLGQNYVWKQTGSSVKNRKQVPVKIGTSNSTQVEILEGLSEGDTIVYIP